MLLSVRNPSLRKERTMRRKIAAIAIAAFATGGIAAPVIATAVSSTGGTVASAPQFLYRG